MNETWVVQQLNDRLIINNANKEKEATNTIMLNILT